MSYIFFGKPPGLWDAPRKRPEAEDPKSRAVASELDSQVTPQATTEQTNKSKPPAPHSTGRE